jgi:peptidoglycan biosynthesis protein MviN/MurJ (putative lipid II flippase)
MSNIASRVRRHLTDPESQHRHIATGFLWVSLFALIGKLAGAAKEMAIAWRYGVSETVDAYVFVFNLISWPVAVWFSVLTVVLVPLVADIRHNDPNELPRFRGELLGLALIVGIATGLLGMLGIHLLLTATWTGLSPSALSEALRMAGGLALLAPMGVVISLFSAWMLACGRHRNTLLEAIPALVILIALLLPPNWLPEPLLWGTILGFALHLVALSAPLRRRGELQTPKFAFTSPAWRNFWGSIGIMAMGQMLMSLTAIIDQFFTTGLGPGALSTLSYANRILALILGMGAMAISRAILPILSKVNAQSGAEVNSLALRWAILMFIGGIFAVILGWMSAHTIVSLLFERGAFNSSNTENVSNILKYSLIQIPFYAFSLTLANLMASKKRYIPIFFSGVLAIITKIISVSILVPIMKIEGIALSMTFVYLVNSILFIYILHKDKKNYLL